jgi:hypothetical protein
MEEVTLESVREIYARPNSLSHVTRTSVSVQDLPRGGGRVSHKMCIHFFVYKTSFIPINICRGTLNVQKRTYDDITSQLDATITNFIDNYNRLNMFRAIILPILGSTRLCLQLVA